MSLTDKYYKDNSKEFILGTKDCNMSVQYNFFLKYLNKDSKRILDLGFGSGRDSLYFKSLGYDIYAIDPVEEFCKYARDLGLDNIYNITAEEMTFDSLFDGIWACASLLHIESNKLIDVFNKCYKALNDNGIMYCSFKYGTYEGERKGRYFTDLNEEMFKEIIEATNFKVVDTLITDDVRPDREERWLNVIIKK